MKLTKNFSREEFDCKDGTIVPDEFLPNVQEVGLKNSSSNKLLIDKLNNTNLIKLFLSCRKIYKQSKKINNPLPT